MGDDITIGVTEIVNNIEVTAQPNDQIVDISVIDNADEVTLNITPTVIEINVNKGSSYARWGTIYGNLTDQTDLTNALLLKADLVDGKVPAYQLPSFVDDVVEVANYAALPAMGEIGKIYVTLDNNKIYRWSGSIYIEIASNNAIWGAITGTLSNQTDLQNALNLKQNSLSWIAPLSVAGGTVSISYSGVSTNGALSSTDWNTFNNKQPLISHLEFNNTDKTVWNNGKGNVSSNTSFGEGALKSNTTGVDNTGFGYYSLSTNTTGSGNVAMGIYAGWDLQTNNNISGTPSGSNSAPVANDDVRFTSINTPISGNLLTNDYDVDGNTLSITQFVINGTTYAGGSIPDIPSVGTIIINTNGTFTFSPNLGYSGAVPIVTYTISDGAGGTDAGVLSIFVVNDYSISVSNNSVFLGTGSRPLANNQNNQIVIGYNAVGSGSDTVTIGNNSITTTRLKGEVQGGSFKKDGGTSSQFLKADGSVDITTYAIDSNVVHKTGAETITGTKTFNNSTTSSSINISNSSTGKGIECYNSSTGTGFYSNNNSSGIALYSNNNSSGRNLLLNNTTAATGMPFTIQKQGVDVATISDAGVGVFSSTVQASAFRLSGMTAGSGALYWTSDRVTLANYNATGVVHIEANGGTGVATFGGATYNNDFVGTGRFTGTLTGTNANFSGNVGIGTTSPTSTLNLQNATTPQIDFHTGASKRADIRATSDSLFLNSITGNSIQLQTDGSTKVLITSGGNVGIGTTSPDSRLQVKKSAQSDSVTIANSAAFIYGNDVGIAIGQGNVDKGYGTWVQSIRNSDGASFPLLLNPNGGVSSFGGNVGIGTTSPAFSLSVYSGGSYSSVISNTVANNNVLLLEGTSNSTSQNKVVFANGGSVTGTITTTASTTSYNTSSDYRLKQDLQPINGLDLVSQINVYDYEWKSDETRSYGVLAHELQEVIPQAVTGEKDGENMQGVDYSKLVPILVQAIQELKAEIELLKAK